MATASVQRTLLVGLGELGARTADRLLARLAPPDDGSSLIAGLAVLPAEVELSRLETRLLIPPETGFDRWQRAFESEVERVLESISRVSRLDQLTRQGLDLRQADEIHVIIIANLAESWLEPALMALPERLRRLVDRMLACYVGLTGVLLYVEPDEPVSPPPESQTDSASPESETVETDRFASDRFGRPFDRGCFVAGLTNENGMLVDHVEDLIERVVYFLETLEREAPSGRLARIESEPGPERPMTSFGVATLRWPGRELVGPLSARWTQAILAGMTRWPVDQTMDLDLPRQAREAAQQLMSGSRLAPPLLLDTLAATMPPPPYHLADQVPDPAWPWLLKQVPARLDTAARQWQETWLAAGDRVQATLDDLADAWLEQAGDWLRRQTAPPAYGAVLVAQSRLAAVSELLDTYIAGVEARLETAEDDLKAVEQQLGSVAGALDRALAGLPDSPGLALLRWGLRPLRWPGYWLTCRRSQALARNLAHLTRARLLAWQNVSAYETIVPFYHDLRERWQQVVGVWERTCRTVWQAVQSSRLANWPAQLETVLAGAGGPWTGEPITALYQAAVQEQGLAVWEQCGGLGDWVAAGLEADTLIDRLREQTSAALTPVLLIPVDEALGRQLPEPKLQAAWLTNLIEQARPFWPYNEATLAEPARAQAQLETWLLLPGAETSLLAGLNPNRSRPTMILASPRPDELGVISLRHIGASQPVS
ncbi:MAG TPA: hypothetical protein VGD99_02475 [Anaerolineae bacterium]